MKVLSVGRHVQLNPPSNPATDTVQAAFQFDLEDCARHAILPTGLPPSADSKSEGRDSKSFSGADGKAFYDVTYSITANAFSGRDLIASTTEHVIYLPLGQTDPPSYGSLEVAGEHFTARTEHPRSRLSKTKPTGHQLDIAGQEPLPLTMQPQNRGPEPSTTVELVLKMSPQASHDLSSLPQQAHIHTQLVQKTRITPNGAKPSDTSRRRREDPDSQLRLTKRNAQDCTLSISSWKTYQPDGEGSPGFAIARLSFLYRQSGAERLSPTFSTPLLSRSYALEVKVSLPEHGGQSLKVSLPVQVMYEQDPAASARVADVGVALEPKVSTQSRVSEIPRDERDSSG